MPHGIRQYAPEPWRLVQEVEGALTEHHLCSEAAVVGCAPWPAGCATRGLAGLSLTAEQDCCGCCRPAAGSAGRWAPAARQA